MSDISPYSNGGSFLPVLGNGQLPAKVQKQARADLAQVSRQMITGAAKIQAAAFLASSALTQQDMLAEHVRIVASRNPVAVPGALDILHAYESAAINIVRRMGQ